jgi:hypothetical protein
MSGSTKAGQMKRDTPEQAPPPPPALRVSAAPAVPPPPPPPPETASIITIDAPLGFCHDCKPVASVDPVGLNICTLCKYLFGM